VLILISDTAMHEFMLDMREALLIWLALIGLAVAGFALLTAGTRLPRHPWRSARAWLAARRARRQDERAAPARPTAQAQARELRRYADEVAVAAERAGVMAGRRHAEWVAVQRTQEAAWRAYEAADEAARRVDQAALFPSLIEPDDQVDGSAGELTARRRYLHRAATEAHERGELSAEQLGDALFHRNGWDPTLHPFEQQKVLRHVARDRLLRAYQEAAAIERAAWHAYDVAAAAKRSLDDEALDAALRARRAQNRAAEAGAHRVFAHLLRGARVATS
jgi:hypothetical protein